MNAGPLILSFQVAAVATLVAGVVGITVAALLSRMTSIARDVVEAVVTAPMVLPPTVLGYWLLIMLGRDSGVGRAFEAVFGAPLVFGPAALVVAGALAALPFVVKASRAAFDDVDPRVVAAAATLGASPLRVFLGIVLPLGRNGVLAGLTLGFARALGDFGVTLMIAGNIPGHTQTASLAIYDAVAAGRDDDATGLALVLAALGIAALVVGGGLARRRPHAW